MTGRDTTEAPTDPWGQDSVGAFVTAHWATLDRRERVAMAAGLLVVLLVVAWWVWPGRGDDLSPQQCGDRLARLEEQVSAATSAAEVDDLVARVEELAERCGVDDAASTGSGAGPDRT